MHAFQGLPCLQRLCHSWFPLNQQRRTDTGGLEFPSRQTARRTFLPHVDKTTSQKHTMADAPQLAYDQTPALAHTYVEPKRDSMNAPMRAEGHRYWDDPPSGTPPISPAQEIPSQSRTILGLRRRNFILLFGIILVIAIATIGGSIGGSLAVKNSK